MQNFKTCPYCAEKDLQPEAKTCKHCGKNLCEQPTIDCGIALLAIPACSAFLTWFWVGSMPLISMPGNTLSMLAVGTVLSTAICAAIETNGAKNTESCKKDGDSPIAMFLAFLFCWCIAYPYYLSRRRHFGLSNHILLGFIIMAVCIASWITVFNSIEAQLAGIRSILSGANAL